MYERVKIEVLQKLNRNLLKLITGKYRKIVKISINYAHVHGKWQTHF